jgi:hypothetical protein
VSKFSGPKLRRYTGVKPDVHSGPIPPTTWEMQMEQNTLYIVKEPRTGKGPTGRFISLSELLTKRADLQGAYAPADYIAEAIRWSA